MKIEKAKIQRLKETRKAWDDHQTNIQSLSKRAAELEGRVPVLQETLRAKEEQKRAVLEEFAIGKTTETVVEVAQREHTEAEAAIRRTEELINVVRLKEQELARSSSPLATRLTDAERSVWAEIAKHHKLDLTDLADKIAVAYLITTRGSRYGQGYKNFLTSIFPKPTREGSGGYGSKLEQIFAEATK